MNDDLAVKVENLYKTFKLPHEKSTSIKNSLINMARGKKGYEKQKVLSGIDFEIKKGEFFGIVGRNGSGKSTLLKLIAEIYSPDRGGVRVQGSLIPFIELGVGFNMELSGRDNVFLNGALLGFSRKEMEKMYDDIVAFSELERFMDQTLKNYSSGMQVRLAFSIAIRAKGDILLLDEVLAVGDEDFQRKCNDYFEEIKGKGKTVIIVTHDMNSVKRYCSRALLIEKGKIKTIGSPTEVANQYSLDNLNASEQGSSGAKELSHEVKSFDVKLLSSPIITNKDSLEFEIQYALNEDTDVYLEFSIVYRGQSIIEHNTFDEKSLGNKKDEPYKVRYKLPMKNFCSAELGIYASIFNREGFRAIGFTARSITFMVNNDDGPKGGLIVDRGEWLI